MPYYQLWSPCCSFRAKNLSIFCFSTSSSVSILSVLDLPQISQVRKVMKLCLCLAYFAQHYLPDSSRMLQRTEWQFIVWCVCHIIHSYPVKYLDAVVSWILCDAGSTGVQMSFGALVLFWMCPQSGTARSSYVFSFLRNIHTVSHHVWWFTCQQWCVSNCSSYFSVCSPTLLPPWLHVLRFYLFDAIINGIFFLFFFSPDSLFYQFLEYN